MALVNPNAYSNPVFNNPNNRQQRNFSTARGLGKTPIRRYNQFSTALNNPNSGITDPQRQNYQNRLGNMSKRFGFKAYQPAAGPAATTTTPAVTTAPGAATTQPDYGQQAKDVMAALYPQTSLLDPTKYVNQEMYDWENKQGQKGLDRYYASRGLTNSGAELAKNAEFQDKLAANTKADAFAMAQADANRRQQAADRFGGMLNNEADRKMQGGQNQFDNLYGMAQLMLNQSPLTAGYNAASQAGNTQNSIAQMLMQAMGGGGGGGGGVPAFQAPFAAGPDYSAADYANLFGDQATTGQYNNTIGDILSGIFGGRPKEEEEDKKKK